MQPTPVTCPQCGHEFSPLLEKEREAHPEVPDEDNHLAPLAPWTKEGFSKNQPHSEK